jgi:hypothetical protein
MIVEYSADDGLRLSEPNDFRSFKLLVKGGRDEGLPETDGISFVDDHNALIAVSLVPTLPGCPDDASWRANHLRHGRSCPQIWLDRCTRKRSLCNLVISLAIDRGIAFKIWQKPAQRGHWDFYFRIENDIRRGETEALSQCVAIRRVKGASES